MLRLITKRLLLAATVSSTLVWGDTLVLQNGTRLTGSFMGGDSRSVRFAVGTQVNTYALSDVSTLSFDQTVASAPVPANAPYPPAAPVPANPTPIPASPPSPAGVSIPAGAQVVVRLIDPVNSETDSLGQTYRASLDQPVIVDGQTVIPRGADAIATLIDAQKSGHIQGKTVLTLDLKSMTVNGRTYDIVTTGVAQASSSRGARSAKVIGGTAALGAIIGGVAGGGRGAAIGAGSGAAVGTAAEVATSGQKVKIPSETRLTFTLQNPLSI